MELRTSTQRRVDVRHPAELDRALRRCFRALYTPAPLQFLLNVLLYTNTDDVFAARRRLDALERQRGDCVVALHPVALFNVYGAGSVWEAAEQKKGRRGKTL